MSDFQRIRYICDKTSHISVTFLDKFLLYLCAAEEGLDKRFAQMLTKYWHIIQKMPENWVLWLTSQYIAFQLFRRGGLAHKYIDHPQVLRRSGKERDYLKFQIEHPWRFVFCSVNQFLPDSFFEMTDVITGEKFLLYSPGVAAQEKRSTTSMYFLLIGFNGECWQTYGSIAYYKGIQPFDLHYFARQIKQDPVSWDEIPKLIEEDPLPFMMLWVGAELPLTFHKNDMIVHLRSDYELAHLNPQQYATYFRIKEKDHIYKLSLKRWHGFPHFSHCFYSQKDKKLIASAMTERGYAKLITVLNQLGHEFPQEPQIRATPAIYTVLTDFFGKDLKLNPYEKHFAEKSSPEEEEEVKRLNQFLRLLMEAVNSGKKYDLRELAAKAGIEYETAKQIADQVSKKFQENSQRKNNNRPPFS